jgi:hypothetical protein
MIMIEGWHIFFIIIGIICIFTGIFMSNMQISNLQEMTGLDPNPANPLAFIVSFCIIKAPLIFIRLLFVLAGVALIIFMLALTYY